MARLTVARSELDRLVHRVGVDREDLVAYALGEDAAVDADVLEHIAHARREIYDVAMSPLWSSVVLEDDE